MALNFNMLCPLMKKRIVIDVNSRPITISHIYSHKTSYTKIIEKSAQLHYLTIFVYRSSIHGFR